MRNCNRAAGSRRVFAIVVAVVLVTIVLGCGVRKDEPQTISTPPQPIDTVDEIGSDGQPDVPLTVVAPHVLKKSLMKISKQFMAKHPDVRVEIATEVIDALPRMVAEGERSGDILAIMDGPELGPIQEAGAVELGDATHFADIAVIVAAPKGNPLEISELADLTKNEVATIALPDPNLDSAGKAFTDALKAEGLFEELECKLDFRSCPHTACAQVEESAAELGITYAPCVLFGHSDMTLCIAMALPVEAGPPVELIAARYSDGDHPAIEAFTEYLMSSPAQAVFAELGMEPMVSTESDGAE